MPGSGARLPLEGIRVLDFTWVVAGPVATRILADHGAEVIKLERKPGPLGARQTGLQGDLHRNKRSIAVNMGTPRGVEIAPVRAFPSVAWTAKANSSLTGVRRSRLSGWGGSKGRRRRTNKTDSRFQQRVRKRRAWSQVR